MSQSVKNYERKTGFTCRVVALSFLNFVEFITASLSIFALATEFRRASWPRMYPLTLLQNTNRLCAVLASHSITDVTMGGMMTGT